MATDVEYKISCTKTKITVQIDSLEVIEAFTAGKDKVLIIKDVYDEMKPLPESIGITEGDTKSTTKPEPTTPPQEDHPIQEPQEDTQKEDTPVMAESDEDQHKVSPEGLTATNNPKRERKKDIVDDKEAIEKV